MERVEHLACLQRLYSTKINLIMMKIMILIDKIHQKSKVTNVTLFALGTIQNNFSG